MVADQLRSRIAEKVDSGTEVPSVETVILRNSEEIAHAETKPKAKRALRPVLGICALQGNHPANEHLPPGAGYPVLLAKVTPFTIEEIRDLIRDINEDKDKFRRAVAEIDESPISPR